MGEAQVLVLPSSYYREREGTSRQEVCSWLPPALPWEVGWMLRTARMVFTNGYGGHRKSPGLAVRNFDLILLGDFSGKPCLISGPQFPHLWNAKAGLDAHDGCFQTDL